MKTFLTLALVASSPLTAFIYVVLWIEHGRYEAWASFERLISKALY